MSDPNQPYGAVPPPSGPPPGFPPPSPPAPPGFPPPPAGPPPGAPFGTPPGPPQGPPPAQGGKGKGLLVALGVVGVLALVGVIVGLVLVLTGGDDDKDKDDADDPTTSASGSAPDEVVEDLIDAAEDADCDKAKTFLTEAAAAADPCSSAEFRLLSTEDVDAEVGDPVVEGTSATVPVSFSSSAGSTDYEFRLEQVDGAWRVASYAIGGGTDVPSPTTSPSATDTPSASSSASASPSGAAPSGTSTADAVANDPRSVVEGFMVSFVNGDCATAEDLVTAAYLKDEGHCDPDDIPSGFEDTVKYTVGKASVNESAGTATVPVDVTYQGTKDSSSVKLVKVDGNWRINEFD